MRTGRTHPGTGQPKSDKKPGRDQIPGGLVGSVAEHYLSLIQSDWTKDSKTLGKVNWPKAKRRRPGPFGVFFTRPQAGAYEANRRTAVALRPSGVLFARAKSTRGFGGAQPPEDKAWGWVSPGSPRPPGGRRISPAGARSP